MLVSEDGIVVAELRSAIFGVEAPVSPVKFRIVEYADGPFLEVVLDEVIPAPSAQLWNLKIDGSLRGKTTAESGSTWGTRITAAQFEQGLTAEMFSTDAAETVLQSTFEVPVQR